MTARNDGESEYGVPFPGRVLPHLRWTRTGFRDDGGPFDAGRIFGRTAPLVVDLGCGNGRYLISSALARPDRDHWGVDLVQRVIDYAAHRANKRGISNARFVVGDARAWLFERLGAGSADEIHIYHPQPYYVPAEAPQRLLTPAFLERARQVLRPGGILVLQTDNKAYWEYLLEAVRRHFDPEPVRGAWPDAPQGRTRREIIARKQGLAIWRLVARRREVPLEGKTPRLDFDADRPRFRRARGQNRYSTKNPTE